MGSQETGAISRDVPSGEIIRTFQRHTGGVGSVGFARDDRKIITRSSDGSTWMWDVASGKCSIMLFTWGYGRYWLAVTPENYFDGSERDIAELGLRSAHTGDLVLNDEKMNYRRPDKIREVLQ